MTDLKIEDFCADYAKHSACPLRDKNPVECEVCDKQNIEDKLKDIKRELENKLSYDELGELMGYMYKILLIRHLKKCILLNKMSDSSEDTWDKDPIEGEECEGCEVCDKQKIKDIKDKLSTLSNDKLKTLSDIEINQLIVYIYIIFNIKVVKEKENQKKKENQILKEYSKKMKEKQIYKEYLKKNTLHMKINT